MEEEMLNLWMAENREDVERVGLEIVSMKDVNNDGYYTLSVKVRGYMIMVTATLSDPDGSLGLAIPLQDECDETLTAALEALNDKLQRPRLVQPKCFMTNLILDNILQVFIKESGCPPHEPCMKREERSSREDLIMPIRLSNGLDNKLLERSAEDFNVDYETLMLRMQVDDKAAILRWCSVQLIPGMEVVEVRMDIKNIMPSDNVATALQFSLDDPLVFHLSMGDKCTWVSVKESPVQIQKFEAVMNGRRMNGRKMRRSMDDRFKNAIKESWWTKMRPHGPRLLVPDIIKEYLEECHIGPDGRLHMRQRVPFSDNIFVNLVIFVGSRLKTIGAFCAICKRALPPFSRFWCCDKELCLYKFEELGFGASVLQELKNAELIDLELTLAAAATRCSTLDVFEPFPSFLLKEREVRKRAGFFNKDITGINSSKEMHAMSNKGLNLLQNLIDSIPPVSEMKHYSNEIELVVKLGISWLQKVYKADSVNQTNLSQEDYVENIWLPYKILRYVLFTNRLSLCLLRKDHKFKLPGSLYQFAVLYDSESELQRAERRQTEGSVFAFHGSSLSNWYSIIRNGLKCLSGTEYMSTGMAYGEGIYFSTEMEHSLGYSSSSSEWKRRKYYVVALCEIFSGQNYVVANKRDCLLVPPQYENDIVIRYLFVFNNIKKRGESKTTITGGHTLSGEIDLYEHCEKLKFKSPEEVIDGGLVGDVSNQN